MRGQSVLASPNDGNFNQTAQNKKKYALITNGLHQSIDNKRVAMESSSIVMSGLRNSSQSIGSARLSSKPLYFNDLDDDYPRAAVP